jgi:thiosulfate/3-mercaptopyruvate sulfurtransferase
MTDDFGPLIAVGDVDLETMVPVDCRWVLGSPTAGRAAYEDGHLPGAIYASLDDDLSDMHIADAGRHPLPTMTDFAAALGRLGIAASDRIVAYDAAGGAHAARLWWMLRWVGHHHVAVLDGGIQAWVDAGGSLESGQVRRPDTSYLIGPTTMPTVDRSAVAAHPTALLDARAPERFRGDQEPLDPVAGHIPGAVNAPYADNLADGRFLPPDQLADRYGALGVVAGDATVVYCGSGVTACHDVLAMEIAGLGTATLYPGSWSEWSRAGGEVATGS